MYTEVTFSNAPNGITANKLNKLTADLEAAIGSIGGYYTDTWSWTTQTTNVGSGQVGNDSAINPQIWGGVTYLNVSETSASGEDKTIQMDRVMAAGNAVLVKDAANSSNYCEYTVTGPGVDMGTWRQYPVTVSKSSGVPPKNNAGTTLTVYVQGATGGGGVTTPGVNVWGEIPGGLINGSNKVYTTAHTYATNLCAVFLNGVRQRRSDDYTETSASSFTFINAPAPGDSLSIDYVQA